MIQGITVNATGGAPGGIGKRILWLVGYGRYELYQGQDGGDTKGPGYPLASTVSTPPMPEPKPTADSTPSPDSYSGDSSAQRRAEDWLATEASVVLGARLEKRRFAVADGATLEMDGCCTEPPVLCEIWAHIGSPNPAQKHKVMTDALKLVYLREALVPGARCVLVLGDAEAARFFQGASWMAACQRTMGVEVLALEMPEELRESVLAAQRRQYR